MDYTAAPLEKLIEEFGKFQGVGRKGATRMAYQVLSMSDKKRVQLAAFLVQKPYVILFDEPFDYCSENYIRTFLQVLQTVKENHIILISTGLLEIAKQISNEILLLHNGRFEVVPSETLQVQELRRAVLDIIGEADHGNL